MSYNAIIVTIPHTKQRYDTVGDWITGADEDLHIRVSYLGDWKMELCVAIHEQVEAALCRINGISQQQVDNFDYSSQADEPGASPDAPYHHEHLIAEDIEKKVAAVLGVDWEQYCKKIASI